MLKDIEQLNQDRLRAEQFYDDVYPRLMEVIGKVQKQEYDAPELADLGWCMRKIENICDEIRKECKVKKELIGKLIAQKHYQKMVMGEGENSVHGQLAIASPNVNQKPSLPRRDTPEYLQLCEHFNVPFELAKWGLIQFHYQTITDFVNDCLEKGKPIPEGFTKTSSNWWCSFRGKNK